MKRTRKIAPLSSRSKLGTFALALLLGLAGAVSGCAPGKSTATRGGDHDDHEVELQATAIAEPEEPNVPDDRFMDGAVAPPEGPAPKLVNASDANGRVYQALAVPGQLVVVFELSATAREIDAAVASVGARATSKIPAIGLYLLEVPQGLEMAAQTTLRKSPKVSSVDVNGVVASETTGANDAPREWDPAIGSGWTATEKAYLDKIKAPEAWELAELIGLGKKARPSITVEILDAGFDNPEGRYVDDLTSGTRGAVFQSSMAARLVKLKSGPEDHGFLVATILGAAGGNDRKPLGINWYSRIRGTELPGLDGSQVADAALGNSLVSLGYRLLYGLSSTIGRNGAEVISISLGMAGSQDRKARYGELIRSMAGVVRNANALGKKFVLVKSAGNDSIVLDWDDIAIPDNMILAGAFGGTSAPASYTQRGPLVDIYVPGDSRGYYPFFKTDGTTAWIGGTSFSAPIVAGAVSLMWETNTSLAPSQLKERLLKAADRAAAYPDCRLLNLADAIRLAADFDGGSAGAGSGSGATSGAQDADPITITSAPAFVSAGQRFKIRWTVADAGKVTHANVHWGSSSGALLDFGRVLSGAQAGGQYENELTAPASGTIYFVVHARVNGKETFSKQRVIRIAPGGTAVAGAGLQPASSW